MVPVKTEARGDSAGILRAAAPRSWSPAIFGVVPSGANRRRPTDIVRVGVAAIAVVITGIGAHVLAPFEEKIFDLLTALPGWLTPIAEWSYRIGTVGTVVALVLTLLITRRFMIGLSVVGMGAAAWVIANIVSNIVDAESVRRAAGMKVDGSVPQYPVIILATATAAILVAAPHLLRPARRLVYAAIWIAAGGAILAVVGLTDDVLAALAIGWGIAAIYHLAVGSPAATPTVQQVQEALDALGVSVSDLALSDRQVWGESHYDATAPDGAAVMVEVIGRDASDARFFAKIWRSIWYKDSGPTLAFTRMRQLEHRAYVLLLAAKAGVPTSEVVIAGIGGARETAVLVLREPSGTAIGEVDPALITDAALDDAWRVLGLLHGTRVAHGGIGPTNLRVRDDGTTSVVGGTHASSDASPERMQLDDACLLATTAAYAGNERALAAADRTLGHDGLNDVLLLLTPAALPASTRHELPSAKTLLNGLRDDGGKLTGTPVDKPAELRHVSPGNLAMAAGASLGVYLLFGEIAGIDFSEVFSDAKWGWVVVAFLLSPLPQFTSSIALMGAVAAPLPYKPVLGEQFANNFTGLVGGTVANTALVVRFFQKQGQKVAVAVSSGILVSIAAGTIQTLVVVFGLFIIGDQFNTSDTGGDGLSGLIVVLFIAFVLIVSAIMFIPKVRRRIKGIVAPQWAAGRDNLKGILKTPRKAAMLFGGNLASQVLFALVLDASLHAYGGSLPLLQLMVINSLASVLGGMAPVPGGMGVVEAGLIAGLTAAGIPQTEAVAATFTHRLFTAYLPPIWGWFALQWLRRNEYV